MKTMAESKPSHWSEYKEQDTGFWQFKLMRFVIKWFPILIARLVAFGVSVLYYLFSRQARNESRRYLNKLAALYPEKRFYILPHLTAFALSLVERVEAWCGKALFKRIHFQDDDIDELVDNLEQGKGALFIASHLGNMEFARALAGYSRTGVSRNVPVTVIVDFTMTNNFGRMLRELNPGCQLHTINSNDISPETVILLQDRIAVGGIVAIAGDRTSPNTRNRYIMLPFLNEKAPFPYGSFLLAALLNAPSYLIFALRQKDVTLRSRYDLHVHKSPVSFDCSRQERKRRIEDLARFFSEKLEYYCKQHPYQWYNFFDFWGEP
jgi:predicted LPLAT superfamily acyltransferase